MPDFKARAWSGFIDFFLHKTGHPLPQPLRLYTRQNGEDEANIMKIHGTDIAMIGQKSTTLSHVFNYEPIDQVAEIMITPIFASDQQKLPSQVTVSCSGFEDKNFRFSATITAEDKNPDLVAKLAIQYSDKEVTPPFFQNHDTVAKWIHVLGVFLWNSRPQGQMQL